MESRHQNDSIKKLSCCCFRTFLKNDTTMIYYGFAAFYSYSKITAIAFWKEKVIIYCHFSKKHYHVERKTEKRPNENLFERTHFIHQCIHLALHIKTDASCLK